MLRAESVDSGAAAGQNDRHGSPKRSKWMFQIKSRRSTVGREILGGVTTFMAMSYILFVQPAVLSVAGMDYHGVFMATCISAAAACFLMGLLANYPIALAPGMGENFFFVFTLCGVGAAAGAVKLTWQEALALTAVTGVIFLLLSLVEFRSKLLHSIPDSLKTGITAGIGLFIALIGFQFGNLLVHDEATCVKAASMQGNYVAGVALFGLVVTIALMALRVRGAILLGILITTAAAWGVGRMWGVASVQWQGLTAMPHGIETTAGGLFNGFGTLWDKLLSDRWADVLIFAFVLLFMDMFDTVGTLVGVAKRTGLMTGGKLPRCEQALAADAAGTIFGACLGTSTVTSYIESSAGVAAGARTGLAAVVAGLCLCAAMFFQPLVGMVGAGIQVGWLAGGAPRMAYPTIAPALIVVGAMMMRTVRDISWDDMTEAMPGFLTMVTMPFAYSISAGIAVGFISYAAVKLPTGRRRQCPTMVYVFAVLFVVRYLLMK